MNKLSLVYTGILLTLLFVSGCTNNVAESMPTEPALVPTATAVCEQTTGEIIDFAFPLDAPTETAKVYLPPCYNTAVTQTYPVLYLVHGAVPNRAKMWLDMNIGVKVDRQISENGMSPFIVVMPDVVDFLSVDPWFADDLVTAVDNTFRTKQDRLYRAIGGLSMGGGEAALVGIRHPDLFGAIGLFAMASPIKEYDGYLRTYKLRSEELSAMLEAIPVEYTPHIYMNRGHGDYLPRPSEGFLLHLQDAQISPVYTMDTGAHMLIYFSKNLEKYLKWFDRVWGKPAFRSPYQAMSDFDECADENGRVVRVTLPDSEKTEVQLYLPPCYTQNLDASYPALYLLADAHDWFDLGVVQSMDQLIVEDFVPPFVLVSLADAATLADIMPILEKNYRLQSEPAGRSIAGIGSDADDAFALGLTPESPFGSVGAYRLTADVDLANLDWYVRAQNVKRPFLFMDTGNLDTEALLIQTDIQQLLTTHNTPHFNSVGKGGTDDLYLIEHVENYLFWHGRQFGRSLPIVFDETS